MVISKIGYICTECGAYVECSLDDVEFSIVGGELVVSLECQDCGAYIEEEPIGKG